MVDRVTKRAEQSTRVLNVLRDFVLDKLRADDEYAEKLVSIGTKYRAEVENRPELCEFPPIFTSLIGDIEQSALARQQLREQILNEIFTPIVDFVGAKQEIPIKKEMNFVKASLAFRDFEMVRQEFIKETLTKLSVVNSILAETEDDISRRFGSDVEAFNAEEYIQQLLKQDEPFFPKQEQTKSAKAPKKTQRVTWREELEEVIGYSDTESKSAPVFVAESPADEEAFAEIAAITGRKVAIVPFSNGQQKTDAEEPAAAPAPTPAAAPAPAPAPATSPTKRLEPKKNNPLDVMDSFLSSARASSYIEELDNFEEQKKAEQEKKEREEAEKAHLEQEEKKNAKPMVPPKPSVPSNEADETKLRAHVTETVSCQYIKGHLQRCDLAGQVGFTGTIRKDTRSDFSFDFSDMTDVENVLPNKAFVHANSTEGLKFTCNMRALSHFVQPKIPAPALKYKVTGNSIANKIPLILTVAWKCEPNLTSIIITYKSTPEAAIIMQDVVFEVVVTGVVAGIQAKPQAQWNGQTQSATWSVGTLQLLPGKEVSGKLLGRFSVQQLSTPAPVNLKFRSEGTLMSNLELELSKTPEVTWLPVQKQVVTGKYLGS